MSTHIYDTFRQHEQNTSGTDVAHTHIAQNLHVIKNWKYCVCRQCSQEFQAQNAKQRERKKALAKKQASNIMRLSQKHRESVADLSAILNSKTALERKELLAIMKKLYAL